MFENSKIKSEINDEIIGSGKKNAIIAGVVGVVSSAIIIGIVLAIRSKKKKNETDESVKTESKPEIILPEEQEVPQVNEDQVREAEETAARLRQEFKQIYAIPNSKETINEFGFGYLAVLKIGEDENREKYQGIKLNCTLGFIDIINGEAEGFVIKDSLDDAKEFVTEMTNKALEETNGNGYSSTEEAVEAMLKILHGSEKD